MNDFKVESPPVPSRSAFAGTRGGDSGYKVSDGGYAQEIKKLAVLLRGNKELGYIRQDTPAYVFAGKTIDEAMQIGRSNPDAFAAAQKDAPYILDKSDAANPRYKGTTADWKAVEEELNWVEKAWAEACGPEPGDFDSTIRDLADSAKALYDQSTGIQNSDPAWRSADQALTKWTSTAASNFRNNMWYRTPNIIRGQASVAAIMAHALAAERDTWVEHRRSLEDIAKKTITALNALKVDQPNNDNANLTILAGIFTMVAGVATIPFTGGVSTGAVIAGSATIAAGVATVGAGAAAHQTGKPREVPLGAATVSEVLLNMSSAMGGADADAKKNEGIICDGLRAAHDNITNAKAPPAEHDEKTYAPRDGFVIPRPALINETGRLPAPRIAT